MRFYLRVDVEETYNSEPEVYHTKVSVKEILEENEGNLESMGYLTPKAIEIRERLNKAVPSNELICVHTAYTRPAESSLRNLTYGDYTLCLKVDPLTVLDGENLKNYKKYLATKERAAKAAETKRKAAAEAKEARKIASAKKLLESKGIKVDA